MADRELWRGLRVIWNHTPRGGYGFTMHVPATVVSLHGDRVKLDVERTNGLVARRIVKRASVWVPCEQCRPIRRRNACGCEPTNTGGES